METKSNLVYRCLTIGLLAGILTVQLLILLKLPTRAPSVGELMDAKGEQQEHLMRDRPFVQVRGNVGIEGTADVRVR